MDISTSRAQAILSRHTARFHSQPRIPQSDTVTDAPLLGNGDVGVSIGGGAEELTFYVCKNDFWVQAHVGETTEQRMERLLTHDGDRERRTGTRIVPLGYIDLKVPGMHGAKYLAEQDIYAAEMRGRFHVVNTKRSFRMSSWVCAVENLLVIELHAGDEPLKGLSLSVHAGERGQYERFAYSDGIDDDIIWVKYAANYQNVPGRRVAGMAARLVSGKTPEETDGLFTKALVFDLTPGESVVLAVSILSDLDDPDCLPSAVARVRNLLPSAIQETKDSHRSWWDSFWRQSIVSFDDPLIEQYYYGSQYILASSTREGKVVPGLFGNWVTTDRPRWTGSYTLNYNYESPFWALFTANHGSITRSYADTLIDVIPIGKAYARRKLDVRGIYLPVELGPWGTICSTLFHGQKSNALYTTVNLILDFYYTWDTDFIRRVWPYLKEVVEFWEDYLVFEDGRYVVVDDALGEQYDGSSDKNPIITLAYLRFFLQGMIRIAGEIHPGDSSDGSSVSRWKEILTNLSPYTTFEHNGKTVFRLTEEGTEWREQRGFAPFCITYPCGEISGSSDPRMRQIAYDTLVEQNTWDDFNAFQATYPTAARVGYNPGEIFSQLRSQITTRGMPNLWIFHGGGGIEECNGIPGCINEMMLQSHDFIIRVFPNWESGRNGYFMNLRAYGAFLVTGEIEDDVVQYVVIESERGRRIRFESPWGTDDIRCLKNGNERPMDDLTSSETTGTDESNTSSAGIRLIELDTDPGDCIIFFPKDRNKDEVIRRLEDIGADHDSGSH